MSRVGIVSASCLAIACSSPPAPEAKGAPTPTSHVAPQEAGPAPEVKSAELTKWADDLPGALAEARRAGKLVLVDAWATWCHTCLSMKNYVLTDPSLTGYRERLLFVELDTDREVNADFMERYAVEMLPSFFVLDGEGAVLGMWPGSASLAELRGFLDGSIEAHEALSGEAAQGPLEALVRARRFHAESKHREAAAAYAEALKRAPPDWPRESEVLKGWLGSLARAGQARECVRVGMEHLAKVRGASIPADFSLQLMSCAEGLRERATIQRTAKAVTARLTALLEVPPMEMSPDDVADALRILGYAHSLLGDRAAERAADQRGLEVLEAAAKAAPEPELQATFDSGRAAAYLQLGRVQEALEMLEARERQLPTSAEAPARLSLVYQRLGRMEDAILAIGRAVKLANGPRRLMYLERQASFQSAAKRYADAVTTLEAEVAGWAALSGRRARPQALAAANKRLAQAKRQAANAP